MPQIFRPGSNTFSRVSIFGFVFIVAFIAWLLTFFFRSPAITRVDKPISQPVPFSHQVHVTGLGLDCRYCHKSVQDSSFADLPPTETCMTCHSQILTDNPVLQPVRDSFKTGKPIQWTRVYDLPDYVYFDHAIHISKGIGCESCHGNIGTMPLTSKDVTLYMEWCLRCHRHPENFVRPLDQVFTLGYKPAQDQQILGPALVQQYQIASPQALSDCVVCHR